MEPRTLAPTPEPANLRAARRHVKRLRDLLQLCEIAALVLTLTAVVNALTSPNRLWFLWVALGFAIALGFAALDTFGRNLWLGYEWPERKAHEILARQAR